MNCTRKLYNYKENNIASISKNHKRQNSTLSILEINFIVLIQPENTLANAGSICVSQKLTKLL